MTTKSIKLVEKKEFAAVIVDLEHEIFVVYITSFSFLLLNNADIYPFYRLQIVSLIAKKALIKISIKYTNFANMFFLDLISKFPKHTEINNDAIKLINS